MTSSKKPGDDAALTALVYEFFNEIGIIAQLSGTMMRRALPDGMTMAQFTVLNHFARLGGERTPAQLAASFQVTKGAITNTLQRLEAKNHITIKPDETDRRRKLVTLTDEGLKTRNETIAALATPGRQLSQTLDMEGLRTALPFLQKVRAQLDDARTAEDFADV